MSQWLSLRQVKEDARKQAICHMIGDSMFLDAIQTKEGVLHPLSTTGWNLYFEYPDNEPRSLVAKKTGFVSV